MSKPEKIVLFNGTNLDNWVTRSGDAPVAWQVENGVMTGASRTTDIMTKEVFGDAYIHLEFRIPDMPDKNGQHKGNSGVFLHGRYEIQVLDSFGVESGRGDCSAIYDKYSPLLNNCLPAEQWQALLSTYRTDSVENTWRSLFTCHELFRDAAKNFAAKYGYTYPDYDENVSRYDRDK